jgi:hypothetical protein
MFTKSRVQGAGKEEMWLVRKSVLPPSECSEKQFSLFSMQPTPEFSSFMKNDFLNISIVILCGNNLVQLICKVLMVHRICVCVYHYIFHLIKNYEQWIFENQDSVLYL